MVLAHKEWFAKSTVFEKASCIKYFSSLLFIPVNVYVSHRQLKLARVIFGNLFLASW